MMKRIILFILLLMLAFGLFVAWRIFGPNTYFKEDKKSIFIKSKTSFYRVRKELDTKGVIKNTRTFWYIARLMKYPENVKPGKYVIEKGASIYEVLSILRSGKQTPVNLVITKLRTKEDLIEKIASNFECEGASIERFINSNDSLAPFNVDTNTVLTAIIPNSYQVLWNSPCASIFTLLYQQQQQFWNKQRLEQARAKALSPKQVYILASIVEEETNKPGDRPKIASVYLNRLKIGMRLGADPTVKFALKDFGLKRIYHKHLQAQSPYNTYLNGGLPPGPICTPSIASIDAVLTAPASDFLYFVARPQLDGYSNFSATYQEHLVNAKAYQRALDTLMAKRRNTAP